jgi:predicted transcriptional regulator
LPETIGFGYLVDMVSKKPQLPTLTRAESEIMQILWAKGRATVHEVVDTMSRPVAYTTVLTILRILERKGYVGHEPAGGRAYVYAPRVEHEKAQRQHVRELVERLFAGNAHDLVAGLVEEEKLSRRELEELRAKIDQRLGTKERKR